MDWRSICLLLAIIIVFAMLIILANKNAKEEIEKREIIERILKQNEEYEKINEKLKEQIKELKNENKK